MDKTEPASSFKPLFRPLIPLRRTLFSLHFKDPAFVLTFRRTIKFPYMNFRGHIQITAFILYPDRRNHKGCLEFLGDGLDFRREPLTGREQAVESVPV